MSKIVTCIYCKHSKFRAGVDGRLAVLLKIEQHPYATHTCTKYDVTRERPKHEVNRLSVCIRENGGELREVST